MSKEQHETRKAAMAEISRLVKIGGGRITPTALVAAASDPESPLHDYFEWDDTEAAHKYREMQARTLLRSCNVVVTIENRKVPIPQYIRDPDMNSQEQGYIETARIRTDAEAARETLLREFGRAASLISRAHKLARYFDLQSEFDELNERMASLRVRMNERIGAEATLNG